MGNIRRRRWQSKRVKICLMIGALLLSFAALEAGFRLAGLRGEFDSPRGDFVLTDAQTPLQRVPHGFYADSTVVSRYSSDPRGYFGPSNSVYHHFNSAGWRDREHSLEKPSGTLRILGLGDSYLYGQGVQRKDICLSRLEELLQRDLHTERVECINTGMSGFNTVDQYDLFVNRGIEYQPDLVILHFVLNDVEPNVLLPGTKVEFYSEYLAIFQQPDALSRYSYFWSWARQRFLRSIRARQYINDCVNSFSRDSRKWKRCRDAIDDIRRACDEHDLSFLVVIFPFFIDLDGDYPFQAIHDVVREHCESNEIHVLDLRDEYRQYNGPELWVHPTDQHPNETAHRIAAEAMTKYLRKHPELLQHRRRDD